MDKKYCRICWNKSGWRKPTGDARWIERNTYVAKNGFGHEEWLFNYEWNLNGYKYGYLQPISDCYNNYAGEYISALLYTVTPNAETFFIAVIEELYIPTYEEQESVFLKLCKRGMLDEMRIDVKDVNANIGRLKNPEAYEIFNVRFKPEKATLFDPRLRLTQKNHKIVKNRRYKAYEWDGSMPPNDGGSHKSFSGDPRRNENKRTRSAQKGTEVDPRHTRLQNRLYDLFIGKYGEERVKYEENRVDLVVRTKSKTTFYEIKMDTTVRGCIRSAIGQLLEYAYYPSDKNADTLVVVSDAVQTPSDKDFLNNIRKRFKIPIYYARFDWEKNKLYSAV